MQFLATHADDLEDNSRFTILTIDDEFYIHQRIKSFLEEDGVVVFEAENSKQGIEVFNAHSPDLILLDLRMPKMDGLEVLGALKARAPDTPVVVASGTRNITSVVDALRLGANDYIFNPIEDMTVLYHSIQKCLKESELKRLLKTGPRHLLRVSSVTKRFIMKPATVGALSKKIQQLLKGNPLITQGLTRGK